MELLHGPTRSRTVDWAVDNVGGGGGEPAFYKRDSKAKMQEKARKEFSQLLKIEEKLKGLHFTHKENQAEFKGLVENYNSWMSQEGKNSNK